MSVSLAEAGLTYQPPVNAGTGVVQAENGPFVIPMPANPENAATSAQVVAESSPALAGIARRIQAARIDGALALAM